MLLSSVSQDFVLGCNLDHAFCSKPNECVCDIGWSGPNCDVCVTQPNCPDMGNCKKPGGCACENSLQGRCTIRNNPPIFSKTQYYSTYKMTAECLRFNRQAEGQGNASLPRISDNFGKHVCKSCGIHIVSSVFPVFYEVDN